MSQPDELRTDAARAADDDLLFESTEQTLPARPDDGQAGRRASDSGSASSHHHSSGSGNSSSHHHSSSSDGSSSHHHSSSSDDSSSHHHSSSSGDSSSHHHSSSSGGSSSSHHSSSSDGSLSHHHSSSSGDSSSHHHSSSSGSSSSGHHSSSSDGSSSSHHSSSSGGSSSSHHSSRSGGSSSGHHSSSSGGSSSGHHSSSGSSSSRSSARREAEAKEREHRDALIGKYQVVVQNDILSDDSVVEHHSSHHHHHHHHRRSRRRRIRRIAMIIVSVLLALLLLLAGGFGILHLMGKKQLAPEPVGVQPNVYAVSYDEGKTLEYNGGVYELNEHLVTVAAIGIDHDTFGLEDDLIGTAGQADMILLLTMDLESGAVRALMIPRDTVIDVDQYNVGGEYVGVKKMQICLSFAYGDGGTTSAENVLTSVSRILYGIPLDLYGVMDLDGIAALNDAVGGVPVTLTEPLYDYTAGMLVTLHGEEAQTFVRYRDVSQLNSDAQRRSRQITYLHAFVDKIVDSARSDIGSIRRLYNTATQYAFTNISLAKATYLASTLLTKGATLGEVQTLAGEMVDVDPYPEFRPDKQAVFETVLDMFYTRVE